MHILYVVHQFFPDHYTGTERLVLNLCKQMQRCGHRVTVLTYGITDTEGFEDRGKFLVKHYRYQGVPVISVKHKVIPDLINFTIIDDEMVSFFDTVLTEEEIDVMHICHMMRVGSVIRSAQKRSIPVVLTLTDFWLMCPRGIAINQGGALCDGSEDGNKCLNECYRGSYWRSLIRTRFVQAKETLTYASSVVSATRFLRNMFANQGFRGDMKIIPFGKDYQHACSNNRLYDQGSEITIGYLSSLNAHKGAHLLLEAYQQVNPPNVRLQIFGDTTSNPEYFEILKKIARDNPKIEFCGRYNYESMPKILEKIDIVAVPSLWWENSPLVLLRSLVHTVPAIVSDLGGLTEVITDGVNGFTFSVGHSDSLADNAKSLSAVIRTISENPSILNELKAHVLPPPRIEDEAFAYENLYYAIVQRPNVPQNLKDLDYMGSIAGSCSCMKRNLVSMDEVKRAKLLSAFGADLVLNIDVRDEMFQFLANHPAISDPVWEYFNSGRSMLETLEQIFLDNGVEIKRIDRFLDFACGYGRFTRFLALKIPAGRISVSDIDRDAVDFCMHEFGVSGFYSAGDPKDLDVAERFDVIWVASLFSHLPLALWEGWLEKLYSMLAADGLLIFSTHGLSCLESSPAGYRVNAIAERSGFYYVRQSESQRLDAESYGTTYVSSEFVQGVVKARNLGKIASTYPKMLWNFQDIYVLRKSNLLSMSDRDE